MRLIGEIADCSLGKMLDKAKNKGRLRPYLGNANVRWFDFELSDLREMRFQEDEDDRYTAIRGDVLVCEGGQPGRAAVWNHHYPIHFQKAIHRVRFREEERASWLVYFLYHQEATGALQRHFTGTGIQHLSSVALARLPIPVPPLREQKRVVAILDEAFAGIDAAIANTERNLTNARELFESNLSAAFVGLALAHQRKRLIEVCEKITVGYVGPMVDEYQREGLPFLRSKNVRPFGIDRNDLTFISSEFHSAIRKSALQPGDVVIVRTGYPGTAAVIPEDLPAANCSDLVIARPASDTDPHYLALFLNSAYGKSLVGGRLTGAAQKHFNVTAAKEVPLPVPPLSEQRRIVAQLHAIRSLTDRMQGSFAAKIAEMKCLKQSILQKAFAGELTAKEAEKQMAVA